MAQGGLWAWLLWPPDQALGLGFYKVCRSPASSRWTFPEMLPSHLDSRQVKAKGGTVGTQQRRHQSSITLRLERNSDDTLFQDEEMET